MEGGSDMRRESIMDGGREEWNEWNYWDKMEIYHFHPINGFS